MVDVDRRISLESGQACAIDWLGSNIGGSQREATLSSLTIVIMMTGISRISGSAFSAKRTLQPSMSSIITSRMMATGGDCRARRNPSSPLAAAYTQKPSLIRKRRITSRCVRSSWITNTRLAVGEPGSVPFKLPSYWGAVTLWPPAFTAAAPDVLPPTTAGRLMVKTFPSPGMLLTFTSPPIISQKRRVSSALSRCR